MYREDLLHEILRFENELRNQAAWPAPLTRIAEGTALVTLPIGMIFIIPHLVSPQKIWELVWPPYWNLTSPILWDFFAVSTYATVSLLFWYIGLVPDLATFRDKARKLWQKKIYGVMALGWRGSARLSSSSFSRLRSHWVPTCPTGETPATRSPSMATERRSPTCSSVPTSTVPG